MHNVMTKTMRNGFILLFLTVLYGCNSRKADPVPGSFAYDVNFLKSHKQVILLGRKGSPAQVLIVGDYQARVMTSTAGGDNGNSYGWINYDLIRSGENKPHMNPYGGEDRFWLGPEGGQYGLYFKKGDPFDFQHWQTPALIDTEPFDLLTSDSLQASFRKSAQVINWSGTVFQIDIDRTIRLIEREEAEAEFGIALGDLRAVAFQSVNSVTNRGKEWQRKNGLLSIWILGMFRPTDGTTIILPHRSPVDSSGITDDYFGAIPVNRIHKKDSMLLLKGDGKHRGKVGIAPGVAVNMAGSYDADKRVLTLVKFDVDPSASYVNSKWEMQQDPYRGDAVNAYNDGPQADGSQLGPFYELESSSPAVALKEKETLVHRHTTLHVEGSEEELNNLALRTLGISLTALKKEFSR